MFSCSCLKFLESKFIQRSPDSYDYHCSLLSGPLAEFDSITYGVNYRSPLNDLAFFHVVSQLPQDIMHIILEGAVPYTLRLVLHHFISEKSYFNLYLLNEMMLHFKYSHAESGDKPRPLSEKFYNHTAIYANQVYDRIIDMIVLLHF